jgi:hypothetical protein
MSNVSASVLQNGTTPEVLAFEVSSLKRTTILTGKHHIKPK